MPDPVFLSPDMAGRQAVGVADIRDALRDPALTDMPPGPMRTLMRGLAFFLLGPGEPVTLIAVLGEDVADEEVPRYFAALARMQHAMDRNEQEIAEATDDAAKARLLERWTAERLHVSRVVTAARRDGLRRSDQR